MLASQYSHGSYYTKNKRPVKNIEDFFYELQIMYLAYWTVKAVWFLESELEADVLFVQIYLIPKHVSRGSQLSLRRPLQTRRLRTTNNVMV